MSIETGQRYEDTACEYLQARGLHCIARNVRYRFGEIDLVMRDEEDLLIFVEVRARRSSRFGGANLPIALSESSASMSFRRRCIRGWRDRVGAQCLRCDIVEE
jgi:putative endonuclease